MENMTAIWLVAIIVLLLVEAVVPGLVSIWFALGALAALLVSLCSAPVWLQGVVFLVVSVLSLLFTRPFVQKYVNSRTTATNADAAIGKECIVTETIDNVRGTGSALVEGKEWTARSGDDAAVIPEGTRARVLRIEGVKVIVEQLEE